MEARIQQLLRRFAEIENALGDPGVFSDKKRYKQLTQEHSYLTEIKNAWEAYEKVNADLAEHRELAQAEGDPEFAEAIRQEIPKLETEVSRLDQVIKDLLVPPDPRDNYNTILEVRAGTGGDEAALFVGDCVRMYKRFADRRGWRWEQLSCAPAELGGYKEYVMVFTGRNVHRLLQYEGGTHRVQRVPETEAQGRVHTSAVTVAVMLEPEEAEEVQIEDRDLVIDTYRASGAGGQHVNVTDSAVRLTHKPTGIVVTCQDERSQIKNRDKAMRILKAKIREARERQQMQEMADKRAQQVGSGDRSEKIRTYNFPQNRLTDHRIGLTKYNLDQVMDGDLEDIVTPLVAYFYEQRLSSTE